MVFGGIQKLTLLDYPDKAACTLFTIGCNFDCPYCHNPSLIRTGGDIQTIGTPEVFDFLKKRQGLLDGVCISGGEPLIHSELGAFTSEVKALGYLVKIDTNGSYPERLIELAASGTVDYIAMDVKNTPEKYAETINVPDYDISPVEESISFLRSGTIEYEFRTTVVRQYHTVDDLRSVARWLSGAERYYLQGFIDTGAVPESGLEGYNDPEMRQLLQEVKEILPTAELRGIR